MTNNIDWEQLKYGVQHCNKCSIRAQCKGTVFGVGFRNARVLVIGEAPGATEDNVGKPFQGRAGKLLRKWLYQEANFVPQDLFVTNILKCRPPNNRDPHQTEKSNCFPWLTAQVKSINPEGIIFVGRISANYCMGTNHSARRLVSQNWSWMDVDATCIYHPAFILRPNGSQYETITIKQIKQFKALIDAKHVQV